MSNSEKLALYARAKDAYYNGQPIMSDSEFDLLEKQLEQEAPGHPLLFMVGSPVRSENKVKHTSPMLSTDKALTNDALDRWVSTRQKEGAIGLVASAKLDGMSLELRYINGVLNQAVSRGDGEFGEDCTVKARYFVPSQLSVKLTCRIRGEALLKFKDFEGINGILQEPFSNPRNGVAGIFNEDALNLDKLDFVSFRAYEILDLDKAFYTQQLELLESLGFDTPFWRFIEAPNDTAQHIDSVFTTARSVAQEPWDGVVVRINNEDLAEFLGRTAKFWKRSIAWKFKPDEAIVNAVAIEWQQGTREITPVIILDPVELDGAVIQRAGVKSIRNMIEIGAFPGNTLKLVRSGGVIPWVQKDENSDFSQIEVEQRVLSTLPSRCPACNSSVSLSSDRAHLRCDSKACKGALARQVEVFAKALGIQYAGPAICRNLVTNNVISSVPDLLSFIDDEASKYASHVVIGEGLAKRLEVEIAAAKDRIHRPERVLGSIGIHRVGFDTAKKLIDNIGSIEEVLIADINSIMAALSISYEFAINIQASLEDKRSEIDRILKLGIKVSDVEKSIDNPLKGKTVVVTGALDGISRDKFKQLLASFGIRLGSTVSKNTDFLVTNNQGNSTKMNKARQLGVRIISQKDLMSMAGVTERE